MTVDKIGPYRTRSGEVVTITKLEDPHEMLFVIRGKRGDQIAARWTARGGYLGIQNHDLDLVEYLTVEDYPELYI